MLGRGGCQPLDGEVGDRMEGEVNQTALEVAFVKVTEKRFVGQLDDRLYEATGGLVLQEDQQRTVGVKMVSNVISLLQ